MASCMIINYTVDGFGEVSLAGILVRSSLRICRIKAKSGNRTLIELGKDNFHICGRKDPVEQWLEFIISFL